MAKNRAPILLNCFSRGGSNIFWNVLLSHPDCCSPIYETLEIFRAGWRAPTRTGYRLALMTGQLRLFDQWKLAPRRPVSEKARRFIDDTLFEHKLLTLTDDEMRFKAEGETYERKEVEESRLTLKNNNGLAFLSDLFQEIWPDATFFALVRHPVPLYESHKRRRLAKSPEQFSRFYNRLARRMLADSERLPRYYLLRFEDILEDPLAAAARTFDLAGLDPAKAPKLRFKAKRHVRKDGTYGTDLELRRHYWFSPEEVAGYFEPAVNRLQTERLEEKEQERVLELTAPVMEGLGYSP